MNGADGMSMRRAGRARFARLARLALGAAVAALWLFHGWLFCRRLLEGTLADPEVLLRWLGAAGLLAAMGWARRLGVPLTRGRPALVLWLLVLLLHVGASPVVVAGVQAQELLLVLPIGLAAVLVVSIARRARGSRQRGRPARTARPGRPDPPRAVTPAAAPSQSFPRPPPALPAAA